MRIARRPWRTDGLGAANGLGAAKGLGAMAVATQIEGRDAVWVGSGLGLRLVLGSGPCSVALGRVHHLAGYAALTGQPDDYFCGWLAFRGQQVPVFDLDRVVSDRATTETFGSRILIVTANQSAAGGPAGRLVGLLAGGVTDTVAAGQVPELDLELYLPMLCAMIPAVPATV
jgi:hypothetical protein